MTPLESRFVRFVRRRRLILRGDRVLVALSGGVDSVVLLHLLRANAEQLGCMICAAHFDHGMREDSAADAVFVRDLCAALGIPLIAARTTRTLSGETAARHARYRFLEAAARTAHSTRIATAHHADDQIETVLFRLLRGTGMRGLAGIPVRRGAFIRPLLRFRKMELLAYAAAHDISFREDVTNASPDFARNRLRLSVLPVLEAARPLAGAQVLALARHAARTEQAWRQVLAQLENDVVRTRATGRFELARPVLLEYHPELRIRMLRRLLRVFAEVPGRAQTAELESFVTRAASGSTLRLGSVAIERAFDRVILERVRDADAADSVLKLTGERGEGSVVVGGVRYDVRWQVGLDRAGDQAFPATLATEGAELRGWRAGDRIRLPYGAKKLKKLFAEKRVAASERARIPVLSDSHGRVLWVVGVARSVDAPAGEAVPALNITVSNAESS